jgi:hypothetical protein
LISQFSHEFNITRGLITKCKESTVDTWSKLDSSEIRNIRCFLSDTSANILASAYFETPCIIERWKNAIGKTRAQSPSWLLGVRYDFWKMYRKYI